MHNLRAASQLQTGLGCRHVVADRGYGADALLVSIPVGAKPHIRQPAGGSSADRGIYRQRRHLVERFLCKLKYFRRGDNRLDKRARNFLAAVALISARIWMRAYESTA